MTTFFGTAFVVVAILLLLVWIGPHVALWILNRIIDRYYKLIDEHNRRQRANRRQIAEALDELQRYRKQQKSSDVGSVVQSEPNQEGGSE